MIGAVEQYQLAAAGQHPDHLAGEVGQDRVGRAVEVQQAPVGEPLDRFATRRLGSQGDDARHRLGIEAGRGLDGHRPAEGVADGHVAPSPVTTRQLHGGEGVEDAGVEIVRSPVADPDDPDPLPHQAPAELVEEATVRAEEPAHGATDADDEPIGVGRAVPQQGQQAFVGEDLQVVELIVDRDALHGQHPEPVEGRQGFRLGLGLLRLGHGPSQAQVPDAPPTGAAGIVRSR